jgi:hypothetical protein
MTTTFAFATCQGYNSKNRKEIFYPNLPSAIRHPITDSDQDFQCNPCSTEPELLSESELNDLVRDLGLPKDCRIKVGCIFVLLRSFLFRILNYNIMMRILCNGTCPFLGNNC